MKKTVGVEGGKLVRHASADRIAYVEGATSHHRDAVTGGADISGGWGL